MKQKVLWGSIGILAGLIFLHAKRVQADIPYQTWLSTTIATGQAGVNGVRIATGGVYTIDMIQVISSGTTDSSFNIYDTASSTGASLKRTEGISGALPYEWSFGEDYSSGVYITNLGTIPPKVRIRYREKSRGGN